MLNSTSIFSFLNPVQPQRNRLIGKTKQSYISIVIQAVTLSQQGLSREDLTQEQIEILESFMGFGGAAKAFEDNHPHYQNLKNAFVFESRYERAKRSLLTSYFTPPELVKLMWRLASRLGLMSGYVLDPSMGSGAFFRNAEASFNGKFIGIELDNVTTDIARALNRNAKVYGNQRFENVKLANSGNFSGVLSNIPFGNIPARDLRFGKQSIHNYFTLRSVDEIHEGGLSILLASQWVMDAKDNEVRTMLSQRSNLVCAIRLPNNVFSNQKVMVGTDILVFQKKELSNTTQSNWIDVAEVDGFTINQYFLDNPQNVIGTISAPSEFSRASCIVELEGEDLYKRLQEVIDANSEESILYKKESVKSVVKSEVITDLGIEKNVSLYEIFSLDTEIYQRVQNVVDDETGYEKNAYIRLNIKGKKIHALYSQYIKVKDALRKLIKAEKDNYSDEEIRECRGRLNLHHDLFVSEFGALQRRKNKSKLRICSNYLRCAALEVDYQEATLESAENYNPAQLLKGRVFKPFEPVNKAESLTEAVSISMVECGRLSLKRISSLLSISLSESERALLSSGLAFIDPNDGELLDRVAYLSGDVRQKLNVALLSNQNSDDKYRLNIEALKGVQPHPIVSEEIHIMLGQQWIPLDVYGEFANYLMETSNSLVSFLDNKYLVKAGGSWVLKTEKFGTKERPFDVLYAHALNGSPIKITVDGAVDEEATVLANHKKEQLEDEFKIWIFQDSERRNRLEELYNQKFNCWVVPDYSVYSDSFDQVQGCTMALHSHQKKSVIRGIQSKELILDQIMGAGKSLEISTITMELKRLYPSERIMIVMPNDLCNQFAIEMSRAYPCASILLMDNKLDAKRREELLNMSMVSNFDALIIPQSSFTALQAPKEMLVELLRDEIANLRQSIYEARGNYFSVKQMEKRLEKRESDFEEIITASKLRSVSFEDLKITTLISDESHCFKNLPYSTNHSNVIGLNSPTGSKMAFDFYVKLRHTQLQGGRTILSTGTSIANSVIEVAHLLRYLNPNLDSYYTSVDSFIKLFAQPVADFSVSPTGRGYKLYTQLKSFHNLPELLKLYRMKAETLSLEELKQSIPSLPDGRCAIPPLKGGEIQSNFLNTSNEQEVIFKEIIKMAKDISQENNMFKIMDLARKATLDVRHLVNQDRDLDSEPNVIDAIVAKLVENHNKHLHFKGNALVFCDRSISLRHRADEVKYATKLFRDAEKGVPEAIEATNGLTKTEYLQNIGSGSFSFYDELYNKLSAEGLKVEIIHDADTNAKKQAIQQRFNNGDIDVLIGSSRKMGTGWNLQKRLTLACHADLPLRTCEFDQRNGRILRQGNEAYKQGLINEVEICTFLTNNTLDSWYLSVLNRKSEFIKAFASGDINSMQRTYRPETEQIDFAQLSALVSGNPLILEHIKLKHQVQKITLLKNSHLRKVSQAKSDNVFCEELIVTLEERITAIKNDMLEISENPLTEQAILIHGYESETKIKSLKNAIKNVKGHYYGDNNICLATLGKFKLFVNKLEGRIHSYYVQGQAVYGLNVPKNVTAESLLLCAFETLNGLEDIKIKSSLRLDGTKQRIKDNNYLISLPFDQEIALVELKKALAELELRIIQNRDNEINPSEKAA